jgi:predicted amidohydrolase YtcJ
MKRIAGLVAGAALAFACGGANAQFAGPPPPPPKLDADLLLTNGRIYTPSGWASGLAIARGVILEVGEAAALEPFKAAGTRVIDLKGQTVLPGLHDMHVHPAGSGIAEMQCQLPHGAAPKVIIDLTAACAKAKKPGEWVTGRAYEAASFGKTAPHRSMLDKVAPNNPVIFTDISGHSAWANSAALKLAGVTRDTPNPPNGVIEKDARGEPTGILRESASFLVFVKVPPPTPEENRRALKWALATMVAQGITAFDDAGVSEDTAQTYADLADAGELKPRVRGCLTFRSEGLIERRGVYARERFSPSCVKVVLDGVPTDGHTAAMLEPYNPHPGRPDDGREKGMAMIPQAELDAMVVRFDTLGLKVKFHAAGDAAVRMGLNAIEAARKANGFSGVLHDVGHNSFVHMDDIRRARSIGAVFEFSPYIWYRSPIIQDIEKAVPAHLMQRWIPVKDVLDAGVLSVPGSDWAVVPSVSPWIALETLVTRRPPGGKGEPLGAAEAISMKQAVDMFTINSARQMHEADRRGTLEKGKLADLVVIDRNIFEVPVETVHQTKVAMTMIGGEVVYEASQPVPAKP